MEVLKMTKTRRPYGSGHIRSVGENVWLVEASHGRRADGKPRRASKTVHGSKADAELELVRLRTLLGAKPNLGDCMTLDEYFHGVYMPTRGPMMARGTRVTYESVYRVHIAPEFGGWSADSIGRADVQRWVAQMPPAMAAKCYRHLRAILRAMFDDELLDDEPLRRRVRLPRHQVAPKEVWSAGELAEAMDRLRGHQLEGLVLVMAGGGLRREEAMALDLPDDLNFASVIGFGDGEEHVICRLVVSKAWPDGDVQRPTTKTYRARPVTIGEPFSTRLREVIADGRPKLLMGLKGKPMVPSSVPKLWRNAFDGPLAGMRYVQLKSLRSLHETMAARGGIDGARNSDAHGHSREVMYDHYLALASDDADDVAEAIRSLGIG